MTENEIEKSLIRDHAHEYQLRAKKKKRLVCEMDKEKATRFQAMLKSQDTNFSEWIKDQINEYMKEGK